MTYMAYHGSGMINSVGLRADCGHFPMTGEIIVLRLQTVGQHDIVGVHAGDILTAGFLKQGVERLYEIVRTADKTYARVGVGTHDVDTAIGGTVVNDEQLKVGKGLRQHAVYALAQISRGIAHGHGNGYSG